MLTPADEEFVRRFRDKRNVLGAAVQLCTLPWLGFVPDDVPAVAAAAVARLSERLGILVGELRGYGAREQTRSDHLRDVAAYLGWRQVDGSPSATGPSSASPASPPTPRTPSCSTTP